MSTTVVINSLVRYDEQTCEQCEPNPFQFTVPSRDTSKWRMKKLPHSFSALAGRNNRDKGGYEVKLDSLTIPASIMPDPEPVVFLEFDGVPSNIDKGYMTKIKCNNSLCQQIIDQTRCNCVKTFQYVSFYQPGVGGVTGLALVQDCNGELGCTGVTGIGLAPDYPKCKNSNFSSLDNTWVAYYDRTVYKENGDIAFYQYKSKSVVSVTYEGWFGSPIKVNIRDTCGDIMEPVGYDLTEVCSYAPLFCKDNQVIAVLNHEYVPPQEMPKSTLSADCFVRDH